MSLKQKTKPKTFFFNCRLEDLLTLLRVLTALKRNRLRSYVVGKSIEISLVFPDFQVRYIHRLATNVLSMRALKNSLPAWGIRSGWIKQ